MHIITKNKYIFIFYLNYLSWADPYLGRAPNPPIGLKHQANLPQIPRARSRALFPSTINILYVSPKFVTYLQTRFYIHIQGKFH